MKRTSLSQTFTLSITLFTLCVVGAVTWFSYYQGKSVLIGELERHGISLAENLAYNSEYGLLFTDVEGLAKLVDGVAQDKDVLYTMVMNAEGVIVAERNFYQYNRLERIVQKRFPEFLELLKEVEGHPPAPLKEEGRMTKIYPPENNDGIYDIFTPVFFSPTVTETSEAQEEVKELSSIESVTAVEQELLGVIVIGLSFDRATQLLSQIQKQILGLALFIVVLAIIVARFLVKTVSQPIEKLARGTRRIAKGDLTQEVQINTSDEIGELAHSFNYMMHELRFSQEKLIQSEKLASIGRLASRIAHELRNPIQGIRMGLELLKQDLPSDQQHYATLQHIDQEITAANKIVQDLLEYAREMKFEYTETDVNSLIDGVLFNLAEKITESQITVNTHYGDIGPIIADGIRIRQAMLNIIQNAIEAMEQEGTLTITTTSQDENSVIISVQDTGCGITPEQQQRIFEPFFTTKEQGVGLGMSVVHKIIEAHNGTIGIESQERVGTTFTIALCRKLET